MARDLKYEDEKLTLVELIQSRRFPEVVRICVNRHYDTERNRFRYYSLIEPGTEVMLQKIQTVKYAHIKILTYYDNDKVQKEKGAECVLEHETYVGEEYLIPLNYRGKVRFAPRPGSRRRYASVSQVLENHPSFIKVGEETECLLANDLHKKIRIPAQTILELKREFVNPENRFTYLECCDETTSYAFQNSDRINCTEVDDSKEYNLFALTRNKMFPKVILFDKVPKEDAILADGDLNSGLISSTEGPLELLGFAELKVVVGWVRYKERKNYRTVLIPEGGWNSMLVQRRIFPENEDKDKYIKRKYSSCNDSDFIDKSMYLMSLDQSFVTWLRNPAFYTNPSDKNKIYEPVWIPFEDSSDDGIYESIDEPCESPPPVPKRVPLTKLGQKSGKHRLQDVFAHLKKKIIQKVHIQKHKSSPSAGQEEAAQKPLFLQRNIRESHVTSHVKVEEQSASLNTSTKQQEEHKKQHHSPRSSSVDDACIRKGKLDITEKDNGDGSCRTTHVYDDPDIDRVHVTDANRESLVWKARATTNRPSSTKPKTIPLEIKNTNEKETHTTLKNAEYLFGKNLGAAHFFTYTVVEVENVLNYCGLPMFARKCFEQKLDGKFFENYDLQGLKGEPFLLGDWQILKVEKIINDGWRPIMCNETV